VLEASRQPKPISYQCIPNSHFAAKYPNWKRWFAKQFIHFDLESLESCQSRLMLHSRARLRRMLVDMNKGVNARGLGDLVTLEPRDHSAHFFVAVDSESILASDTRQLHILGI